MAASTSPYPPGRPPNARDIDLLLNGRVTFLGIIVSTGAAVSNATTTIPFANSARGRSPSESPDVPANYAGTLAGRVLLIQPTAAGHVMSSSSPAVSGNAVTTFTTVPPVPGTFPGPKLQSEERVPFIMGATDGWLQFIPTSGSANLYVWELV